MHKKERVRRIFDSISYRYDLLNHLLSLGIDFYWRYKALKKAKVNNKSILLDVACGTGDFSIAAKKFGVENIFAVDLSRNMLNLFTKKAGWSKGKILQGVAEFIPYKNNMFTDITVAFGVRNFYDIQKGFDEFFRVLSPNGKVTILEFRLPKNKLIAGIYNFYFNKVLPLIGKVISKDNEAYKYLPDSVNDFDANVNLEKLLSNAGFSKITTYTATFGIVQIVIAERV
jgi:demethylmenaquinone methyltransferase/2-methoxy-6-polyprenyl-1,4-benzoquinol methylase